MSSGVSPVMDDSPSSSDERQSASELTVLGQAIGGTGAVEVSTEDVRACASRLHGLADRVRGAVRDLRGVLTLVSTTAQLTTSGSLAVSEGWLVLADGENRAEAVEDLARRLERAADGYDQAEAEAQSRIWRLARPHWLPFSLTAWTHIGTAWQAAMMEAFAHGQLISTRRGVGMALEETLWAFTGIDRPIPGVSRVVADAMTLLVSHRVDVTQVNPPGVGPAGPGTQAAEHGAIGDLEGVVEAIDGLYPDNGQVESGTVRVDRVVAADGAVSWLVLVPGTQGDLVGEQPFDWAGNPGAMIGDTTGATALVVQAMRMAGIRPGEPVMLAGHSQGGMVAMNAANAVADEYEVSGVLTLGSPVGLLDAPTGTEVLSVEHIEDPVPGADNASNPVGEDWTTVERTLTESSDPEFNSVNNPAGSHGMAAYADTARLVDASGNGAVLDYLTVVSPVLDPDAEATSTYYLGARID